ncbi:hypothetical protein [Soonwooa sp.]|uniref:hypothetical protein n=1 Tax=Soonwooa sp. TaxID=1938592 RepID=UPI0028AFF663|nr:hypothetical protein [Soonwooa sp.]
MKYLELQENAIIKLPKSFLKLKYLEFLNISNNKIDNLPAYSRQFENIESINFSNDKLSLIFKEIISLKNLKPLILIANPIAKKKSVENLKSSTPQTQIYF